MMNPKIRRSALYTPGANPTVLQKAARSDADVLIFDLEDAVAPDAKAAARSLERLVAKYPSSSAAQIGRQRLKK